MTVPTFTPDIPILDLQPGHLNLVLAFLLLSTLLPLTLACHQHYLQYLSLGPGGTPPTFRGFLKVQFLALFALKNPYQIDPTTLPSSPGFLPPLPKRRGDRPEVRGIAPQRQITQKSPPDVRDLLATRLKILAQKQGLVVGKSCFETHGLALFSPESSSTPSYYARERCKTEICHVHGIDGSMHMPLHPRDAEAVLEKGWGERHPLAGGGWLERFVPPGLVMVYAPRDGGELEVLVGVVAAAGGFVGRLRGKD